MYPDEILMVDSCVPLHELLPLLSEELHHGKELCICGYVCAPVYMIHRGSTGETRDDEKPNENPLSPQKFDQHW